MIIISQDKRTFVNLGQISCLRMGESGATSYNIVAYEPGSKLPLWPLASYPTESRAKEVLAEIADSYTVYEMPEV